MRNRSPQKTSQNFHPKNKNDELSFPSNRNTDLKIAKNWKITAKSDDQAQLEMIIIDLTQTKKWKQDRGILL